MQIYYFLYLCLGQTIIQVMEIDNQSVDYRPLILVAEDDDSNFKLIKAIIGRKCEIMWRLSLCFVNTVTGRMQY